MIKGFPYPIEKTVKGLFHNIDDISQIKSSMLTIILTCPGDRVMEPYFGTDLNSLIKLNRELIAEEAKQRIAKSLKRWEKRIQVSDIITTIIDNEEGNKGIDLHVQIFFIDPNNLKETQQLVVQTPIGL